MNKYIYMAIAALLMLAGCEYHPYYDGQVMRIYQQRYGVIESNGVHLNVPVADKKPYELEIYGGKGKNHKVTVSDPDVLTYTYTEASVESFLGQDLIPATLTLNPKRLGDTSIDISDEDTGECIRIDLHVVNVFYMMEVYDTQNSLEPGVVIAFEFPLSSEDVKICRRDLDNGDLEYLLDAKCRFFDCDSTVMMELEYLGDENEQPCVDGAEITKRYMAEFADGYSYGGSGYMLHVMNLGYFDMQTVPTKGYMEETDYNSMFRFIDVSDDEHPDLESPDLKMFYAYSAQLEPWIE